MARCGARAVSRSGADLEIAHEVADVRACLRGVALSDRPRRGGRAREPRVCGSIGAGDRSISKLPQWGFRGVSLVRQSLVRSRGPSGGFATLDLS